MHEIPQINLGLIPLQLPGSTWAGHVICGIADLAECVSVPGDFLRTQGAFERVGLMARYLEISFGLRGLREGWVNGPAPEAPLIRGTRRGRRHFWQMPGACGLRPCAGTHQKNSLCHTCPLGGAVIKYRRSISMLSEQYETSYLFYVTLFFLCNIICYLISVFTFSLVILSVATTLSKRSVLVL